MSVDPDLVISIDRTSLSLGPLVFSARRGDSSLGITDYVEPPMMPRVRSAPSSDFIHGDVDLAWSWQQSTLQWSFVTHQAATESESRALVAEVRAAIARLSVAVTVTVSDAPAEVWACSPGPMTSANRRYTDLKYAAPVWSVSLPCYPVRSYA